MAIVDVEVALQEAAAAEGVLLPAPVRGRSGDVVATVDGHPWRSTSGCTPGRRCRRRLVVFGWEHAGGQPPSWELGNALMDWTVDRGRGVNTAGARALVEGYRETAGSLPALDLAVFRGAVTSLANYVSGQIEYALAAEGEDRRYADRSVRHLLTHLPTLADLERLLDVAATVR